MDSLLAVLLDESGSMADIIDDDDYTPAIREWRREGSDPSVLPEVGTWSHRANYSTKTLATLEAFNHFLQVMKYRRDACDFYMAQFAGRERMGYNRPKGPLVYRVTHNFVNLFEAAPLTPLTYDPDGGGTAVYDSIMQAISHVENKIKSLPASERPTQVTVLIQTDGDDNESTGGYTGVIDRMNVLRKERWNFVFVGTGRQGAHTGERLGFTPGKDMVMYSSNSGSLEAFSKAAEGVLESLITGHMEV